MGSISQYCSPELALPLTPQSHKQPLRQYITSWRQRILNSTDNLCNFVSDVRNIDQYSQKKLYGQKHKQIEIDIAETMMAASMIRCQVHYQEYRQCVEKLGKQVKKMKNIGQNQCQFRCGQIVVMPKRSKYLKIMYLLIFKNIYCNEQQNLSLLGYGICHTTCPYFNNNQNCKSRSLKDTASSFISGSGSGNGRKRSKLGHNRRYSLNLCPPSTVQFMDE